MPSYRAGSAPELSWRVAVWLLACFALFAWLGRLDLLDPDEGRHAEIAREMLAAGRWLTPVLHGEPYYEKPAAFYWLLMASMSAFGMESAAARLPSALAALWTVFVSAAFVRRAYGEDAALHTVAGLPTAMGFLLIGRTVLVDMPFCAALTTAFVWLGLWHLDTEAARRRIWPFYLALGIAVLLKGPAAIAIATIAVFALAAAERDPRLMLRIAPLRGAMLVGAVVLPWYTAAWRADPDYITTFFLRNNVERYLRPISTGHVEPWYYYLIALPVLLLPWTPMVALALRDRLRAHVRTRADITCACWAAAVLLFFAPAGTKLATYLLPALPPFACLAAAWTSDRARVQAYRRWLAPWAAAWAVFLAVAVAAATGFAIVRPLAISAARLSLGAFAAASVVLSLHARRAEHAGMILAAIASASLAWVAFTYGAAADGVNALRDVRTAAAIVRVHASRGGPFVAYRCVPHAVAFYARTPARRTRDKDEALAALSHEPGGLVMTKAKRLTELGIHPSERQALVAWRNVGEDVLVIRSDASTRVAEKGGSRTLRRP